MRWRCSNGKGKNILEIENCVRKWQTEIARILILAKRFLTKRVTKLLHGSLTTEYWQGYLSQWPYCLQLLIISEIEYGEEMPNKNYNNGRAREYKLMHKLEAEGYVCFRTAGSHTKVDILAFKPSSPFHPYVRLIQSKKTGYLSPQEREEKKEFERRLNMKIEVLWWRTLP